MPARPPRNARLESHTIVTSASPECRPESLPGAGRREERAPAPCPPAPCPPAPGPAPGPPPDCRGCANLRIVRAVAESNRRKNDLHRGSGSFLFEAAPPHFRGEKPLWAVDCPHQGPLAGHSATARVLRRLAHPPAIRPAARGAQGDDDADGAHAAVPDPAIRTRPTSGGAARRPSPPAGAGDPARPPADRPGRRPPPVTAPPGGRDAGGPQERVRRPGHADTHVPSRRPGPAPAGGMAGPFIPPSGPKGPAIPAGGRAAGQRGARAGAGAGARGGGGGGGGGTRGGGERGAPG